MLMATDLTPDANIVSQDTGQKRSRECAGHCSGSGIDMVSHRVLRLMNSETERVDCVVIEWGVSRSCASALVWWVGVWSVACLIWVIAILGSFLIRQVTTACGTSLGVCVECS